MFCIKSRNGNDMKFKGLQRKDDFGWWLGDEDQIISPRSSRSKDCLSLVSSESMLSCLDSDDSENYFLAQDFKPEADERRGRIELTSLMHDDFDASIIEKDAIKQDINATSIASGSTRRYLSEPESNLKMSHGICYTPERLIQSQEYRIVTRSPRYVSISETRMPKNESRQKTFRGQRQLNYHTEPTREVGDAMRLKAFFEPRAKEIVMPMVATHHWEEYQENHGSDGRRRSFESKEKSRDMSVLSDDKKSSNLQSSDSIGKISSYEGSNITWEDCGKMGTRSSSLEDTSGIHSNDWSSDSHSDLQNTPLCLSDELATTNYKFDTSQERYSAINEVVSILEELDTDPEKAAVLLEEDQFCTSSHNQITRLALAIETDATVPIEHEHPDNIVNHLQNKVKKLKANNRDIFRDIYDLRKSFQCDEEKMADITTTVSKLRQEVQELRYIEDLLNMLRGELERISKRRWPFIVQHINHSEEMNLIV